MLARAPAGFVERHLCHAPHVDPNRWQSAAAAHAAGEPLVECSVVCKCPRTHHVSNPVRRKSIELWFDFIGHELVLETTDGIRKMIPLAPRSVADFYAEFMEMLRSAGIEVKIWRMPAEIPNPIPFDQDQTHHSYDPVAVEKLWRILFSVDAVFNEFRARFIGKSSPVHFFWGSFDLAVTRFSGRRAPEKPGADVITREAYSHEVSSVGFWPGGGDVKGAAFYSYTAPEPQGFKEVPFDRPLPTTRRNSANSS